MRLWGSFDGNPRATAEAIQRFESAWGRRLPDDYARFLQEQANGGEGFIGSAYVILWPVGELLDANSAYEVTKFAPGLLLFGSDGGGVAFAFDARIPAMPVVTVPFIGMELAEALPRAPDFSTFLESLLGIRPSR